MAAFPTRRRIRQRRFIRRKHGWPARIERQEQAALEECRVLGVVGIGWWLYFAWGVRSGSWHQRKAQLVAYQRWRSSYLTFCADFANTLQGWMNTLTAWYEQNKAVLAPLLAVSEQEREQTS